ncbi:MAG TPA: glycerophosphodiester phosphodiesterase family protein [Candidatus Nanopelagicaceae bacterium]|nr:glycerophosphodiester phosphodiesterase family protein [Candidatus Nanopelagicaceae bacterium]
MSPVVIAHRGASHDYAEHTYEAYVAAVQAGADGFECDVRLTADNMLICWHDSDLNRTSDRSGSISRLTWAEISRANAGSWHFAHRDAKPLLFAELLELAVNAGKTISIETKHPVPTGGRVEYALAEVLKPYLPLLPNAPALAQFRMMSFSRLAVRRWKELVPSVPAVALVEREPTKFETPVVGPGIELIRKDPSLVDRLHKQGREVHVWTVDDPKDVALCLELNVDAIITNKPAEVRREIFGALGD